MSNIREVEFRRPDPDAATIAMLEQWLERAKAGDIIGCALSAVRPDSTIATEWTGAANGWKHQLISGVTILLHRIVNANAQVQP